MNRYSPLVLIALAGAAPLALGSGTQLALTAVVAKFASVGVHGQPAELVVTEADVARGYVDVAHGGRIELKSNSAQGLQLEFLDRTGTLARGIEVTGMPAGAVLGGAMHGVSRSTYAVGYRISLAPSARAGIYPWPVQVIASPL